MAPIHDETLPTPLRKTWPGGSAPSCLSPWTRNQEPAPSVHIPRTVDLLKIVALAQLARIGFARAAVRGPAAGVTVPDP